MCVCVSCILFVVFYYLPFLCLQLTLTCWSASAVFFFPNDESSEYKVPPSLPSFLLWHISCGIRFYEALLFSIL